MKKKITVLFLLLTIVLAFSVLPQNSFAQVYGWSPWGSGVNGNVYAITVYNNRIIVAGGFSSAGGVPVNNIAQWDGSSWSAIGSGFNDTVYALIVDTTGTLCAGGRFTQSGSTNVSHIARFTGGSWQQLGLFSGTGVDGDVMCLANHNGLILGGKFFNAGSQNAYHIVKWTGSQWVQLGNVSNNGLNDDVYALKNCVFNSINYLFVGGKFTQTMASFTVNHIASWNEQDWNSVGTGTANGVNDVVQALTIYNNDLYVGGRFTTAGGNPTTYIAHWNGAGWAPLAQSVDNWVLTLGSVNGELVAGGIFKWAGNVYGSRVAKFNGTTWERMITGMNSTVNALYTKDSSIYAGGNFSTAGGKYINHISSWNWLQTYSISGQVRYADSLTFVRSGKVEALRIDVATREIIIIDSTSVIPNDSGRYTMPHIPVGDSLYIISFPEDELEDNFVPTYHPSTIDWQSAVKVAANGNLTGINVNVYRVLPPEPNNILNANISGYVYLLFTPPFNHLTNGYPYWNGSIVYAKQGNNYRGFGISDDYEHYIISNLPAGSYDLYANRMGYHSGARTVVLGSGNYDTANFYLDTADLIGIHKIGTDIPKQFTLFQNYPNPFNPVTIIKYSIPAPLNPPEGGTQAVKLVVYDILGREVATLVNEKLSPGTYEVTFNGTNLASGIYFYRMQAGSYAESRKMLLIK